MLRRNRTPLNYSTEVGTHLRGWGEGYVFMLLHCIAVLGVLYYCFDYATGVKECIIPCERKFPLSHPLSSFFL